jgi:hypothetical protein
MTDYKPFADDAELLDSAFEWLTIMARRLTLERDARDAARDDADAAYRLCLGRRRREPDADTPDRLAALKALEEHLQEEFSGRRQATRADPSRRPLGLDQVTDIHDLSEFEEIVLLTATCAAISEDVANVLWGDLGVGFYGNQTLEGLSRMADAQTTAERLRVRRLLSAEGRLVKSGLLAIDFLTNRPAFPDDFLGARIRLTENGLRVLTGDEPAPTTAEPHS